QELFARLILLQRALGPQIRTAGGMLKTGLYALDVNAADIPARMRVIEKGFATEPFLRDVVGLQSPVAWSARSERLIGAPAGGSDADGNAKGTPKLHAKTHFLASAEAWRAITERPELGLLVDSFIRQMMRRIEPPQQNGDDPSLSDGVPIQLVVQQAVMAETPPETLEKFVAYLMVGSYNQNYRSMLMDGEVMLTVEGGAVIYGLIDYLSLLGTATWVDSLEELEEYLPAYGGLKYMLARSFKEML
ncbi:MAG: hypothetical protein P8Y07_13160, partial [Gemmatimonadales bacterium]